jgi:hypothetical protein
MSFQLGFVIKMDHQTEARSYVFTRLRYAASCGAMTQSPEYENATACCVCYDTTYETLCTTDTSTIKTLVQ